MLLEGKDPAFLTLAHAFPAVNRLLGRIAPVGRIAHDATEQPGIGRRYPVVFVDVELRQRRDIDSVGDLRRDVGHQIWIQPVDALDDDDVVVVDPHRLALLPESCLKVVVGNVHLLPVQEATQLLVEQAHVQSRERFKVKVALFVAGRVIPIDKVIVQLHSKWHQSIGHQLDAQPLGERRLARCRRTGDEHQSHLFLCLVRRPGGDLMRDLSHTLFVESLGYQHHLAHPLARDGLVQEAHVENAHQLHPVPVFAEHVEQLGIVNHWLELHGWCFARKAEDKAWCIGLQGEHSQVACRRHHIAVKIVPKAPHLVEGQIVLAPAVQQPHLVVVASGVEQGDGVVEGNA